MLQREPEHYTIASDLGALKQVHTDTITPPVETASAHEIAERVPNVRRGSARHFILVNNVLTAVTRAQYVEYLQREKARGSVKKARP